MVKLRTQPKKLRHGKYIDLARAVLTNQTAVDKATGRLQRFKRECASAMHNVGVKTFSFPEFDNPIEGQLNRHFRAALERPWGRRIHLRRLYTLHASGEITIDEFLDCISSSYKAVEDTLGEERAKGLLETYQKGLDLVITES